jgi:Ca-activated chloride channel family protein
MQLSALSVAQLLSLLAAASAITVALYLLKLRRRRVRVSFIPLWESLLTDRHASRLFARIQQLISLLIALAIVALLSVALADPKPRAEAASTRHLVVLIDAGVTMQARDVLPNRMSAALLEARRLARSAGPNLQVLVARMDAGATPLSPMSSEPRELERALAGVPASDLPTDHQRAYRFALDVLRGRSGPEIAVLSDAAVAPELALAHALADNGIKLSYFPIGRRGDDVGISAFAVRRYPLDKNRSELLLELYSAATHAETVELTLLGDGTPIDVQHLTLEPGASTRRTYDDVTGVSHALEARLAVRGDHDDLRANDRAYAVLPEKRRVHVLCVTDGNRYLEAALLLDEYLDVDMITPAQYASATSYDMVIFDRFVPAENPGRPALYLEPQGSSHAQPLEVVGRIARPFFDHLQREHPVLRFTALRDANVASALLVRPEREDSVLAADARGPLIIAGKRAGQPFVALTFDLQESDLPLRVAWPLLLLNTIDWFTVERQDYVSASTVGKPATIALPEGVKRVQLRGPDRRVRELAVAGDKLTLTPSRAGFYRIAWSGGERFFAVNLSPDARRDLRPQPQMRAGATTPVARPTVDAIGWRRPPWALLVLAVLLLVTAEWLSYHRRWTV